MLLQKCDNILLEALPGVSESDFWAPPSDCPPFQGGAGGLWGEQAIWLQGCSRHHQVSLAAARISMWMASRCFWQQLCYTWVPSCPGCFCEPHPQLQMKTSICRNRGTEYIKSPEMLKCALADNKGRSDYDRRKNEGAGAASDVWSLGCLLFELVTGHFLFFDPDWICFFMRITQQQEVRLSVILMAVQHGCSSFLCFDSRQHSSPKLPGQAGHKLDLQSSQSPCLCAMGAQADAEGHQCALPLLPKGPLAAKQQN